MIPVIVKSYERQEVIGITTTPLRKRAIQTIDGLSRRVNFSDHASRIIHPLVRVLESSNNELRMAVMDTLCSLVIQLGSDFAIFVPTINKVVRCYCPNFDITNLRVSVSVFFEIASLIRNTRISSLNCSTENAYHKKLVFLTFCLSFYALHHNYYLHKFRKAERGRKSSRILSTSGGQ